MAISLQWIAIVGEGEMDVSFFLPYFYPFVEIPKCRGDSEFLLGRNREPSGWVITKCPIPQKQVRQYL